MKKIFGLFLKLFLVGLLFSGNYLMFPMSVMAAASTDLLIYDQPTSTPGTRTNVFRLNTSGVIWDEGGSGTVGTSSYPYATGYFTDLDLADDLVIDDDATITGDASISGVTTFPVTAYTVGVGTTITPTSTYGTVTSTGGALTVTATVLTSGTVTGQIFILRSATDTITISDEGTDAGSNVQLGNTTRALSLGNVIGFMWNGTDWIEMFYRDISGMGEAIGGNVTIGGNLTVSGSYVAISTTVGTFSVTDQQTVGETTAISTWTPTALTLDDGLTLTANGPVSFAQTLGVTGKSTLSDTVTASKGITGSTFSFTGAGTVSDTLTASKGVNTSTISASGNVTLGSSAKMVHTPNTVYALAASSTIASSSTFVLIGSTGSTITLTSTPNIGVTDVATGSYIMLTSTGPTVVLQDEDTLVGSQVVLSTGSTLNISSSTVYGFLFDGTNWRQVNAQ